VLDGMPDIAIWC